MSEYWQRGESIDYTNTGGTAIKSGDVISFTTRIGVAGCDIPVAKVGSVHVTGVFIMPKSTSVISALSVGEEVYWNLANKNISTTASGNIPAGWVIEPVTANDTDVKVKIG